MEELKWKDVQTFMYLPMLGLALVVSKKTIWSRRLKYNKMRSSPVMCHFFSQNLFSLITLSWYIGQGCCKRFCLFWGYFSQSSSSDRRWLCTLRLLVRMMKCGIIQWIRREGFHTKEFTELQNKVWFELGRENHWTFVI